MNIRYDLLPGQGLVEVCKVLSNKLEKHGKNEWLQGIPWSDLLSNLEKHLLAFKSGEDYYGDANLLNIAAVAEEALLLCEAYTKFPHFDDRLIGMISRPRIALDIDDVCLDFLGEYEKRFGKTNAYWNGDYNMLEHLTELQSNKDFWCNLPLLHMPSFEPVAYITSRSIPNEWTMESLQKAGLPCAPVYSVPWNESKTDLLKKLNIQVLIDDKISNLMDAQEAGIYGYLMDQPHNRWFKTPEHRRIYDLNLKF